MLQVLLASVLAIGAFAAECNFKGKKTVKGPDVWKCFDALPPPDITNATDIVDSMILSWTSHSFIEIYRDPVPPHTYNFFLPDQLNEIRALLPSEPYASHYDFYADMAGHITQLQDGHSYYLKPNCFSVIMTTCFDIAARRDPKTGSVRYFLASLAIGQSDFTEFCANHTSVNLKPYIGYEIVTIDGRGVSAVLTDYANTYDSISQDMGSRVNGVISNYEYVIRNMMFGSSPRQSNVSIVLRPPNDYTPGNDDDADPFLIDVDDTPNGKNDIKMEYDLVSIPSLAMQESIKNENELNEWCAGGTPVSSAGRRLIDEAGVSEEVVLALERGYDPWSVAGPLAMAGATADPKTLELLKRTSTTMRRAAHGRVTKEKMVRFGLRALHRMYVTKFGADELEGMEDDGTLWAVRSPSDPQGSPYAKHLRFADATHLPYGRRLSGAAMPEKGVYTARQLTESLGLSPRASAKLHRNLRGAEKEKKSNFVHLGGEDAHDDDTSSSTDDSSSSNDDIFVDDDYVVDENDDIWFPHRNEDDYMADRATIGPHPDVEWVWDPEFDDPVTGIMMGTMHQEYPLRKQGPRRTQFQPPAGYFHAEGEDVNSLYLNNPRNSKVWQGAEPLSPAVFLRIGTFEPELGSLEAGECADLYATAIVNPTHDAVDAAVKACVNNPIIKFLNQVLGAVDFYKKSKAKLFALDVQANPGGIVVLGQFSLVGLFQEIYDNAQAMSGARYEFRIVPTIDAIAEFLKDQPDGLATVPNFLLDGSTGGILNPLDPTESLTGPKNNKISWYGGATHNWGGNLVVQSKVFCLTDLSPESTGISRPSVALNASNTILITDGLAGSTGALFTRGVTDAGVGVTIGVGGLLGMRSADSSFAGGFIVSSYRDFWATNINGSIVAGYTPPTVPANGQKWDLSKPVVPRGQAPSDGEWGWNVASRLSPYARTIPIQFAPRPADERMYTWEWPLSAQSYAAAAYLGSRVTDRDIKSVADDDALQKEKKTVKSLQSRVDIYTGVIVAEAALLVVSIGLGIFCFCRLRAGAGASRLLTTFNPATDDAASPSGGERAKEWQ